MKSDTEHYLREELVQLMQTDPRVFEFLESGSLDGTWYWDLNDPDHEWMSDRFWEVFGYPPSEMPHLPSAWQDMIHPDDLKTAYANVQAHLADPNHPYDQVVRYTHRAGHTVWVRCRGMAIRDETGKPVRMLGAHQDITGLKQAEAKLHTKIEELARVNGELERFAYAASHDIRSPAVTLNALLERLHDRHAADLDSEGQRLLTLARTHAARVQQMGERVLDYSTVNGATGDFAQVDVSEVVARALRDLSESIEVRSAEVSVSAMPTVRVDPELLRIALRSLIDNALLYNASKVPRVVITGEAAGDTWTLSVADNGIGIAPEHRERIFLAFERLHRRDDYSGTGLGLAMCKQVADLHGGEIQVTDNAPSGTVFTLTLPTHPGGPK